MEKNRAFHRKMGSVLSVLISEGIKTEKELAVLIGVNPRALKRLCQGDMEYTLSQVINLFPELEDLLDDMIEEHYVRKFSIKTIPNSPFGFPHKRGKKS